jgi:glycosidase
VKGILMDFIEDTLNAPRPDALAAVDLPRRRQYHPSPDSWQDEVVYFLLVDRFSDGAEGTRPLLDRGDLASARPDQTNGQPWQWITWANSGRDRFQGGTLAGVTSKLDYLQALGVTTVWLSPVFRQRAHLDTYHGYGIQDFLEVDPRFGRRDDLVDFVQQAHQRDMRVLLDVIYNHSGANWLYPSGTPGGESKPRYTTGQYQFGNWRGDHGQPIASIGSGEDGVWPSEFADPGRYTRAGTGSLDASKFPDIDDAEFRRTDFEDLRDFALGSPGTLSFLARAYMYWIALTDCDGFRIDTVKHVSYEQARNFCGAIKEYATNLGKRDFFLVAEIPDDNFANRYLNAAGRNLNAALDISDGRLSLRELSRGRADPTRYFSSFDIGSAPLGSHRNLGDKLLSVLDDHDHVYGEKLRFAARADNDHQAAAATALQLLTLGIPCLYYGTEQGFAGPEQSEWQWLPEWGSHDRYLREAMFGPRFPRAEGRAGVPGLGLGDGLDHGLPGFGPFGTAGAHCFDPTHPLYLRIAAMTAIRAEYPVLRAGRQSLRPVSVFGEPFGPAQAGELFGWSRILVDEEALCIVNPNGLATRGANVLVDAELNPPNSVFTVIMNSAAASGGTVADHPVGSQTPVRRTASGAAYAEIRNVGPSEVLVLVNRP